ncbi:ArsR family transcriptional regulator [Methanosarcinales archaeon ex4484_138]|nr:MAG: ArsR family transcriptional regulator [Methanosarcinales archaeon ex4484_138]RLG26440.1 MAG: ArsR family transcriptional regulator [Methanosarcinales archaeon]RLG26580.1 MAG: ArsR family transcriptional regulator [Methanosarcinales archaeon]HHI30578.1 ArsR family transcriptional regulator [Candidatus Methanoperedenaceae archaeon]
MGKRTRIINDPSELIALLRIFGSKHHKKVFDVLSGEWKTIEELSNMSENNVAESLSLLKKSGLVESKWRVPQPGKTPDKEYHASYSKVHLNFQCSIEDLSDLILLTFRTEQEIRDTMIRLEKEVKSGNQSMNGLCRVFDRSPVFIKGVARRSPNLNVKGQRIEWIGEKE